ncbi:MAG: HPr family phosphocarrier protein [Collinsella intestinalis]|nr:HPr family phosphocarrier protein [Collinsella intestinalis]
MLEFSHVILGPEGLHARPVTCICSEAHLWKSSITVALGGLSVNAADLMGLMGLMAKCGDELIVTVNGPDEEACCEAMRSVFDF